MLPKIDISIIEGIALDAKKVTEWVENVALQTLQVLDQTLSADTELSLLIADDATLHQLNLEWRGRDKPTNVLSFPVDNFGADIFEVKTLGDIAISVETVEREAYIEEKSFEDHFKHMIVHGILHLFGYDHESNQEAEEMESLEIDILASLNISNPYQAHIHE